MHDPPFLRGTPKADEHDASLTVPNMLQNLIVLGTGRIEITVVRSRHGQIGEAAFPFIGGSLCDSLFSTEKIDGQMMLCSQLQNNLTGFDAGETVRKAAGGMAAGG